MLKTRFSIVDETEEGNTYWMAAKNDDIIGMSKEILQKV
jgi:hypothetical protein